MALEAAFGTSVAARISAHPSVSNANPHAVAAASVAKPRFQYAGSSPYSSCSSGGVEELAEADEPDHQRVVTPPDGPQADGAVEEPPLAGHNLRLDPLRRYRPAVEQVAPHVGVVKDVKQRRGV